MPLQLCLYQLDIHLLTKVCCTLKLNVQLCRNSEKPLSKKSDFNAVKWIKFRIAKKKKKNCSWIQSLFFFTVKLYCFLRERKKKELPFIKEMKNCYWIYKMLYNKKV